MSFHTLSNQLLDIRNEVLYSLARQVYNGLNGKIDEDEGRRLQCQRLDKLNLLYDRTVNKQGCLSTLYRDAEEFNIVKPLFMTPVNVFDDNVKVKAKFNFKVKVNVKGKN